MSSIRITEITVGVGDNCAKKKFNFARSFDSVAEARSSACEYDKRIVCAQMTPKPAETAPPVHPTAT